MFSGGGRITFKSVVKGAPNLTCIVGRNSDDVIYPADIPTGPGERAVLQVYYGATSCQVEKGGAGKTTKSAVFVVHKTRVTVKPLHLDPVFGIKAVANGSLIQVKRGSITVAGAGQPSTTVNVDQQVVVPANGTSVGSVMPLKLDPALKPMCQLIPDLLLTDVKTASGAHPGGNPLGLAPDPSGHIWFTDNATPAIGFFDPTNGQITYPPNSNLKGSKPTFIVADPTGTIWFTDAGTTPAIGMIDPKAGTITEYSSGLPPGSVPWNPMYDPVHKLLWFTDRRGPTGAIGVLDPTTKSITEYTTGLNQGSHPEGLAVDAGGNVWFTDDNGASPAIGVLDGTTRTIHEYSNGLVPGSLPRGVMIDPEGNIWFADERTGDGLIGTISTTDPKHAITEYAVASNGGNLGSTPEGLAWYRGYVWFTDDGAKKAIGRLDPTTGAITESSKELAPDSHPIGILVTKNVLWFTDRFQGAPKIGKLETKPSC
jgi:streptogramin lyase